MVRRNLTVIAAALLCLTSFGIPAAAAPQQAAVGRGDLDIADARGDGPPDIVRMTVRHSRRAAAEVAVRVRGVRTRGALAGLQLYVDPHGQRRRPSYAIVLGLNGDGGYGFFRTRGWRDQPRRTLNCGERVRLLERPNRVRVVRFRFPFACFGDTGARFAARTERFRGGAWRTTDWTPRARTLSRTFRF